MTISRSIHGGCTTGDEDYRNDDGLLVACCDECGEQYPLTAEQEQKYLLTGTF